MASDAESPSAHADRTGSISSSSSGIQQSGEEGSGLSGQVMVHMTGEVRTPGVVRVRHGSRVSEAVDQAGGLRKTRTVTALTWPGWSLMVNRSRFLL